MPHSTVPCYLTVDQLSDWCIAPLCSQLAACLPPRMQRLLGGALVKMRMRVGTHSRPAALKRSPQVITNLIVIGNLYANTVFAFGLSTKGNGALGGFFQTTGILVT